jgi:DNA-binding transcriptional LysR family regulator
MSARDELADLLRSLVGDTVPDWTLVERIVYLFRDDPQLARLVLSVVSELMTEPPMPGVAWLRENAKDARVTIRCGTFLTMIAAANASFGIAALPCFMADSEPALRRVSDVIDRNDCWLVVHPDLRQLARVRAVMDVLDEVIAANAKAFRG